MGRTATHLLRLTATIALALPVVLMPSSAPADCEGPSIQLNRGFVEAGRVVRVEGTAWSEGACEDEDGGCGGGSSDEPMLDVSVTLQRKGVPIQSTTADGPEFRVTIHTEGLMPGDFRVVAEHGEWRDGEPLTVAPLDG